MSTAIDYKAMLRQAKVARKATSNPVENMPISASDNGQPPSRPDKGFLKRPVNRVSLVNQYQVSPEGLDRAFYVPDFISSEEEAFMLSKVRLLQTLYAQPMQTDIGLLINPTDIQ